MKSTFLAAIAAVSVMWAMPAVCAEESSSKSSELLAQKQRLIVLTDIEAEADDTQSLIRLLLYANEIDIEGFVASTSVWLKQQRHPESIRALINEYGKVRSNLLLHRPGYPTASQLLSRVSEGQPSYGMSGVGTVKTRRGPISSFVRSNQPTRVRYGLLPGAA